MPVRMHRPVKLLVIFTLLVAANALVSVASANQPLSISTGESNRQFLPVLFGTPTNPQTRELDMINQLRANAGVPLVNYSPELERNCFEHTRYMAENGDLTHEQNSNLPFASKSGQTCAQQADLWLGSEHPPTPWEPHDAIEGWMYSVPHRLWLLYPTTKVFGFSFYTSPSKKSAAAALDVLGKADFGADETYDSWPVRYPGNDEQDIPATRFPISLNWRYFGPEPVLKSVRLTTANGKALAYEIDTQSPAGHKAIQIIPKSALPKQSKIVITVTGQYDGTPFSYTWQFYTGSNQNAPPPNDAAAID